MSSSTFFILASTLSCAGLHFLFHYERALFAPMVWVNCCQDSFLTEDDLFPLFFFLLSVFLSLLFLSLLYSDHLLSDTFVGQDSESPSISCLHNNNHLQPYSRTSPIAKQTQDQPDPGLAPVPVSTSAKRRLSVERSLSSEDQPQSQQPQQSSVKPARVYTISTEVGMLGARSSEESLELEVLKGPQARTNQQRTSHRSGHGHHHHAPSSQPLQSSGSAHNIRDWGSRRSGSKEDCPRPPCHSQRSLDLDTVPRDSSKQRKKLERMYSEDRVSTEDRGEEKRVKDMETCPSSFSVGLIYQTFSRVKLHKLKNSCKIYKTFSNASFFHIHVHTLINHKKAELTES